MNSDGPCQIAKNQYRITVIASCLFYESNGALKYFAILDYDREPLNKNYKF
jgi:hypothetical protein